MESLVERVKAVVGGWRISSLVGGLDLAKSGFVAKKTKRPAKTLVAASALSAVVVCD